MSHMYFDTFITVAPDFAGDGPKVPQPRGTKRTVAQMQYDMLADSPFMHTQEDVLFQVWFERQDFEALAADEIAALRADYFSTGRACLRASPLTKSHGWGVEFNSDGQAALWAVGSDEYQACLANDDLTVLAAMRSKRA